MTFWEKAWLVGFILSASSLSSVVDKDRTGGVISALFSLVIVAMGTFFVASGKKEE